MKLHVQILLGLVVILRLEVLSVKLREKFKWRDVSFEWPSEATKQNALQSGQYVVKNNLPLGLERWRDKLFITVPR